MTADRRSTIYYQEDEVVVRLNGEDRLRYKSVEQLVEAHIKGMLAELRDPEAVSKLKAQYGQ